MKHVSIIRLVASDDGPPIEPKIGSAEDRGCVACRTIYKGEWYVSGGGNETLVIDARGRYWCLACAVKDLARKERQT